MVLHVKMNLLIITTDHWVDGSQATYCLSPCVCAGWMPDIVTWNQGSLLVTSAFPRLN